MGVKCPSCGDEMPPLENEIPWQCGCGATRGFIGLARSRSEVPRNKFLGVHVPEPGEPEPHEAEHFIQCELCGGWIDCRDLETVFQHEGPLPHPPIDRAQ